ncbi:shikimate dehydrogenase [Thalassococcus sp. S3]|uniref:shikimate dehydrogenase family protein n=1 Tax=Thalassococcus sp. S3 TaxID=2017482 RepID=UPI0010246B03|nr:shikimate dehydrogenase [Thalassococcus sp. S3]QBF34315.1 shikimate dehydrogenase [Thalassococcus sp. S3]
MTTLRAGLIGAHIGRTRLPAALDILCSMAGWTLDFTLIDTAERPAFDLARTLDLARADGWTGMTITHPWKPQARLYAGTAANVEIAHLGALNTLTFSPVLCGYNTDYTGFLGALEAAGLAPLGDVVMIGAGGVAEALGPALLARMSNDACLKIADIEPARAENLAARIGARRLDMADLPAACAAADGVINATPLGMGEDARSPFDPIWLGSQRWAFDAVYTPTNTPFLQAAGAAGLTCLTGFELFRHMAIGSFTAYTGIHLPAPDALDRLLPLRPD